MAKQNVIICQNITDTLQQIVAKGGYPSIFILTDSNTSRICLPRLRTIPELANAKVTEIPAGDENKNIEHLANIWQFLSNNGATRKSLMINLGGGMITDIGGFAASTFKRGMAYINIPTSLLGTIDAAVGGKTGINFNGLKNEVGVINPADYVLIDPEFFRTLDHDNFLSGYAEMLKHGLISSKEELLKVLKFDLQNVDFEEFKKLLESSIAVKEYFVEKDPKEQNIRKALNFGHTIGHAIESYSHEIGKPILHGYAVAFGMVCELYLSHIKTGFPLDLMRQINALIYENYRKFDFGCKSYNRLYELMTHDKKNTSSEINFTLLANVGELKINQTATKEEIFEALDFYRDAN